MVLHGAQGYGQLSMGPEDTLLTTMSSLPIIL